MEVGDKLGGVGEGVCGFPRRFSVRKSEPTHLVAKSTGVDLRVEDLLDVHFLVSVDDGDRRRRSDAIWNVVETIAVEERDMEDVVNLHLRWEGETVGGEADLGSDGVGAEVLVIELLCAPPLGDDVARGEPKLVADLEFRSFRDVLVKVLRHSGRCVLEFLAHDLMKDLHAREGLGGRILGFGGVRRHGDVEARMVAVVGEERGLLCRRMYGVVVDVLAEGKERFPVVLLVVAVDAKVLLDRLVDAFRLTV